MARSKFSCGGPGGCLICYSNGRKRTNISGHFGFIQPRKVRWYVPLSQKFRVTVSTDDRSRTVVALADDAFAQAYPTLSSFLTETEWEDGSTREAASVTLFIDDGLFKLALNDRDGERTAYVAKSMFKACWEALEKGLVGGSLDWRKWRTGITRKKRS